MGGDGVVGDQGEVLHRRKRLSSPGWDITAPARAVILRSTKRRWTKPATRYGRNHIPPRDRDILVVGGFGDPDEVLVREEDVPAIKEFLEGRDVYPFLRVPRGDGGAAQASQAVSSGTRVSNVRRQKRVATTGRGAASCSR